MTLKKWVSKESIKDLNSKSKNYLKTTPFPHSSISNFLNSKKAEELFYELKKEEYYLEDHDLYSFLRTVDFKHSKSKIIQDFRKLLLSPEMISFVETLTSSKLDPSRLDLHSLKLIDTHYLLCHNDEVQGRKIAFILNLTKNNKTGKGGELVLYSSNNNKPDSREKSYTPEFNRFSVFSVSPNSFHEILEVEGGLERVSFSGWYYERG